MIQWFQITRHAIQFMPPISFRNDKSYHIISSMSSHSERGGGVYEYQVLISSTSTQKSAWLAPHQVMCYILSTIFGLNGITTMFVATDNSTTICGTTVTFWECTNFILCGFVIESDFLFSYEVARDLCWQFLCMRIDLDVAKLEWFAS